MNLACLFFFLYLFFSCAQNVLEQIVGFLTCYRSVSDILFAIFIGLFGTCLFPACLSETFKGMNWRKEIVLSAGQFKDPC